MLRRAAILWCATVATAAVAVAAAQNEQPANRGEEILNSTCTGCHDLRPVEIQALDKTGWTDVVDRMVQRGTAFDKDSDIPVLVDYLVQTHGPLPNGAGKNILLNTCTVCHDLSRVRRHAATPEQWEETLGAMLNEGAMLSEQDFR